MRCSSPLFLSSWFLVLFVYKALRVFWLQDSVFTFVKAGEWAELCLAGRRPRGWRSTLRRAPYRGRWQIEEHPARLESTAV